MKANQQIKWERLQTSIEKCRIHQKRLRYAAEQTNKLFPLTIEKYTIISG